jgi:hypothetical protein
MLEPSTESAKLALFSTVQQPRPPFDAFCCAIEAPKGRHEVLTAYDIVTYDDGSHCPYLRTVAVVWDGEIAPPCVTGRLRHAAYISHSSRWLVFGDLDCSLSDNDREAGMYVIRKAKNSSGEILLRSGETGFCASAGLKGIRYEGSVENWGALFDLDLEQDVRILDAIDMRLSSERLMDVLASSKRSRPARQ